MDTLKVMNEQLKAKRGEEKGFTLMEMLIVVAIIAILIAIAIPVFTTQLDSAKQAADEANARSVYALASANYMTDQANFTAPTVTGASGSYSISYGGTDFTFSDKCTALTVGTNGTNGAPSVEITTNGDQQSWNA